MAKNYWLHEHRAGPDWEHFLQRYKFACRWASGTVLDVACGYGYGSNMIAEAGKAECVLAGDRDTRAIQQARKITQGFDYRAKPVYVVMSDLQVDALPYCDWGVTLETVEHLPEHLPFIERLKTSARLGVVLSTPILPNLHTRKGNYHSFTSEEINGWFDGWDIEATEIFGKRATDGADMYHVGAYTKRV